MNITWMINWISFFMINVSADSFRFCEHLEDGIYSNAGQCNSYISCKDGISHRLKCPFNLRFNPKDNSCEFPKCEEDEGDATNDIDSLSSEEFDETSLRVDHSSWSNNDDTVVSNELLSINLASFCEKNPDKVRHTQQGNYITCIGVVPHLITCPATNLFFDKETKTCKLKPLKKTCQFNDNFYKPGESFISCNNNCTCMGPDVTCTSLCKGYMKDSCGSNITPNKYVLVSMAGSECPCAFADCREGK